MLVSEELRVLRASPWALLDHFAGEARGFWGRGSGWVAHGGLALDLVAGGIERFAEVRGWLDGLSEFGNGDVRMFGGFSFSSVPSEQARWKAFPGARFQVPRFEVRADGETFRVIGRALVEGNRTAQAVREDLRTELAQLEQVLASPPPPLPKAAGAGPNPVDLEERRLWMGAVRKGLDEIAAGRLRKVVLARSESTSRAGLLDPLSAVRRLFAPQSSARVFLFEPEPGQTFLGASPETLARVHGGEAHATAVAGSIRRGDTPEEDAGLKVALLGSEKDLREQDFVVREIVARLSGIGGRVRQDPEPHVLTLPGIHHLETRVSAGLPDSVTALDLIERLHPTPAVCGQPNDRAFRFIEDEEGLDRGWYGAPVGWLDAAGNGVTAPALRCALMSGIEVHFFAGAGIVEGSDPAKEWDETRLKLQTARAALGSGGAAPSVD